MKLEDLQTNASVRGILPDGLVTVVGVQWFGSEAVELTYKTPAGKVANELLYRDDEPRLDIESAKKLGATADRCGYGKVEPGSPRLMMSGTRCLSLNPAPSDCPGFLVLPSSLWRRLTKSCRSNG